MRYCLQARWERERERWRGERHPVPLAYAPHTSAPPLRPTPRSRQALPLRLQNLNPKPQTVHPQPSTRNPSPLLAGSIPTFAAAVISVERVRFYKNACPSKRKFHMTVVNFVFFKFHMTFSTSQISIHKKQCRN